VKEDGRTCKALPPNVMGLQGRFNMSGLTDSIRERRAQEIRRWEDEEEDESLTEKVAKILDLLLPRLTDFAIDVMTIALVPTALMLLAIALFQKTSFDFLETGLLLGGATVATLMIANAKTRFRFR